MTHYPPSSNLYSSFNDHFRLDPVPIDSHIKVPCFKNQTAMFISLTEKKRILVSIDKFNLILELIYLYVAKA